MHTTMQRLGKKRFFLAPVSSPGFHPAFGRCIFGRCWLCLSSSNQPHSSPFSIPLSHPLLLTLPYIPSLYPLLSLLVAPKQKALRCYPQGYPLLVVVFLTPMHPCSNSYDVSTYACNAQHIGEYACAYYLCNQSSACPAVDACDGLRYRVITWAAFFLRVPCTGKPIIATLVCT